MAPALPTEFLTRPMAHRAYHDLAQQRPENSRVAVRAAIEAGYGIEIDVQLTSDGGAVVFHDYQLDRLAGLPGVMRARTMEDAQAIPLLGASDETIPSLSNVLEIVDGQVPVLIEIKDQDGAMGPDVGPLEEAVARVLKNFTGGPVAVMSFNPHSVAEMARLCPDLPRGLTTCDYAAEDWPLTAARRDALREIPDFDRVGAAFISHSAKDLARPRVRDLRASGVPILCWTIRSPSEEAGARALADNITFEGYPAALPT